MEEQTDRFKDRFENTEPKDDDVEGHRLAADRNLAKSEDGEDERHAEPDVEAHRLIDRNQNDRVLDRNQND